MNVRFKNALVGVAQDIPPIWFMRQAGRYHAHYQGFRKKYNFMELCKVPELAAEVALGPIRDFDFDVSILFSDLLFPLEALGMGLEYNPAPTLSWQLTTETKSRLKSVEEALPMMDFQAQALRATREVLPKDKSLIGFVGGPWTLFTYAVEGAHKGHLFKAKNQPQLLQDFFAVIVPFLKENIRLQLEAGAEVVMVFDTAAGEVSADFFRQHLASSLCELALMFPGRLGYYSKGLHTQSLQNFSFNLEQEMRTSGKPGESLWAGWGFDHCWDLSKILTQKQSGFIQGNFDQTLLFAHPEDFPQILDHYLQKFLSLEPQQRVNWVCGLGHGVLPQTPERHVRYFVDRVRELFGKAGK